MSAIKEFLTGEQLSPSEVEVAGKKLENLNKEFLTALPEMKKQLVYLTTEQPVEMETRQLTITMPRLYWQMSEKLVECYALSRQIDAESKETATEKIVSAAFNVDGKMTTEEILLSQNLVDALLSYASDIAKTELMIEFSEAMKAGDTETVMKVIQKMTEIQMNPVVSEDNDDPTKN